MAITKIQLSKKMQLLKKIQLSKDTQLIAAVATILLITVGILAYTIPTEELTQQEVVTALIGEGYTQEEAELLGEAYIDSIKTTSEASAHCTDSDGGFEYQIPGHVKGFYGVLGAFDFKDKCTNSTTIVEYICRPNNAPLARKYDCKNYGANVECYTVKESFGAVAYCTGPVEKPKDTVSTLPI